MACEIRRDHDNAKEAGCGRAVTALPSFPRTFPPAGLLAPLARMGNNDACRPGPGAVELAAVARWPLAGGGVGCSDGGLVRCGVWFVAVAV
jgi:hypothetical protein